MGFGVFGKVPFKRDFISNKVNKEVLLPYEKWLQSGVAASHSQLGRSWEQYYTVSSVWRLWFGKDIFGTSVAGVMMPSIDKVGRYFPITLLFQAPAEHYIENPTINPMEDWYKILETRVLSILEEDCTLTVEDILSNLDNPSILKIDKNINFSKVGTTSIWHGINDNLSEFININNEAKFQNITNQQCLFWGRLGQDGANALISSSGLPDPYIYTKMINFEHKLE